MFLAGCVYPYPMPVPVQQPAATVVTTTTTTSSRGAAAGGGPVSTALYETGARMLGRLLFPLATRTVFISANVRRFFGREASPRAPLIYNGVDVHAFGGASDSERAAIRERLGLDVGVPVVLFVGRLVRKKGVHRVLALAARWRKSLRRGPVLIAVTVDHGLRAESAKEANAVKRHARELGVTHRTLRWTGPKPKTGLQEAARTARYRLLAGEAAKAGAKIQKPAEATFWGGYVGYFTDPDGHLWEIAHNPAWPLDDEGRAQIPD